MNNVGCKYSIPTNKGGIFSGKLKIAEIKDSSLMQWTLEVKGYEYITILTKYFL